MKKLILCERPYMLYKALLKALNETDKTIQYDIVLSNHILEMESLYKPLVESKIFNKVYYYDDKLYQKYIENENLSDYTRFPQILWNWPKKLRRYFIYQKYAKREKKPIGLDFKKYDEILANDGVSTMNFKLNNEKIYYITSEHARGNFTIKIPLHILAVWITVLLDRLNIIMAYSGMSKYVTTIEVDSNKNLVGYIKKKKIRVCNIKEMEEKLSYEKKDKLYQIYAKAYHLPEKFDKEVNLLLTNPLYDDKIFSSKKAQIKCYQDAVKEFMDSSMILMVKPHPRDKICYEKVFSNAIIINKVITSEVLSCCNSLKFNIVLTALSSSIMAFKSANKRIALGGEYLKKYDENLSKNNIKIADTLVESLKEEKRNCSKKC